MAKDKIPVGKLLYGLNTKDRGLYDRLTDEEKKDFSPWLFIRFASSSTDITYAPFVIKLVNDIVNVNYSAISDKKHKELHWLSYTAASIGFDQKYQYIRPPNSRKKKNKVEEFLAEEYPTMKIEDIRLMISMNTVEDLKQLALDLGYTDKEIKGIFSK